MKPITIYTTDYCPFCRRAKELLKRKNIPFEEVNLSHDPDKRRELENKTGWMTVPMIFFGDQFIGGSDDLYALESAGKLDSLLAG